MAAVKNLKRVYMDGNINKQISVLSNDVINDNSVENKNINDSSKVSLTFRDNLCFHHRLLHDNKNSFEFKLPDGRTMVAMPLHPFFFD